MDCRGLILIRKSCVPLVVLIDSLNYFEISSLLSYIRILFLPSSVELDPLHQMEARG
jgi:hypothetical protein